MNVKDLLIEQAKNHPQKCAIIFENIKITFSELKNLSFKLANCFTKIGIKKFDKVAVFLPNIPEAIFSFLGTFSIGAILVPLDFMLTEEEIINFINHSEARILIAQHKKGINLENIKNSCLSLEAIIVCGERITPFHSWDQVLQEIQSIEPRSEVNEEHISSIFYTSGSTGHPKGVMLTYKNLDNPVRVIEHFLRVTSRDIFLCGGVPFSHFGGLDYILLMVYFGSTLALMQRFSPLEFLRNIEKNKVTIFCIVPAMYVAILSLKEYDRFDLSSLKYAVVFGAPSSQALLKRFHKAYPSACLLNGWGMTETSAPNSFSPPDIDKLQSIGKLNFNMKAKIVDNKGNTILGNGEGELLVKGDAIMEGYYKDPNLTKKGFAADGWFKTGDIAKKDSGGLYCIVGRIKDMIKVAGEIVFSPEVEEKIHLHPKIKEVAVVGVADNLRGEVPKAFITLEDNEHIDTQELKDFLKQHLAHFKIPHYFEFVKALPKNRTGKIDKQALRLSIR